MAKRKEPKKRAGKYEPKVAVKGIFEDLVKVAVSKPADKKEEGKKGGNG